MHGEQRVQDVPSALGWQSVIEAAWSERHPDRVDAGFFFPLIEQSFDHREIVAMVDVLLSGQLTMADQVRAFEARFAQMLGVPYAVMVNSGSSANLLATAAASNPLRSRRLQPGDEVLVPAVCWPTSVWPLLDKRLVPVFVDVDPATLNADLADMRRRITARTRGVMAVHILGNSLPMDGLSQLVNEHDLLLLEDTCESLGSRAHGRPLGTHGAFGAYSFYYSHHITTGEGGMVVCHTLEDYDLLRALRAHGWSRELSNRAEVERANADIDARFLFVNMGYNLRPTEVQAAIGLCQLDRLEAMNATRNRNRQQLIDVLTGHPKWSGQLVFPQAPGGTEPVWFGFPLLLREGLEGKRDAYVQYLVSHGVENRPIISGNFLRQPAVRVAGIDADPLAFAGAEAVHNRGLFIGLHTRPLGDATLGQLADILLTYPF